MIMIDNSFDATGFYFAQVVYELVQLCQDFLILRFSENRRSHHGHTDVHLKFPDAKIIHFTVDPVDKKYYINLVNKISKNKLTNQKRYLTYSGG
jgi:hypothetical protein